MLIFKGFNIEDFVIDSQDLPVLLLVHCMFTVCSLYVHCTFTVRSLAFTVRGSVDVRRQRKSDMGPGSRRFGADNKLQCRPIALLKASALKRMSSPSSDDE